MNRKAPTYLLDENYYSSVDKLAFEIEIKINNTLKDLIDNFINYQGSNNSERSKSHSEYGLELLYIGVLYLSYSSREESTYLMRLENLCDWLLKTGEFDEIAARFKAWLAYWMQDKNINQDFQRIIDVTNDILEQSKKTLHRYTMQVPEFIQSAIETYKKRDDLVFVTRSINEYYINMVGAQILNHVYQEEFRQADKVFVFVPCCMAAQFDQCKAVAGNMGYTCTKCTSSCPINLTQQTGDKHIAETVIVYHSSELYHTKVPSAERKYGVIGIACVLNLISGGFKARELGYIPQCVLLDYCGCRQHWDTEGLVTDINRERLEQLLN